MNESQHPLNALPQGYRLQEYELVRVLGFGGFGMTYLGFDHNLDKGVAVKEYLPDDIAARTGDNSVVPKASQFRGDFAWGLERFLDEARVVARFDHRNIVKVYRFFEAHGTAYIVMEYAEGETLSAYLARKHTLKEGELRAILYPILDGLELVHGADFLHRDVKPGNIIIRAEDTLPVLLDFGAARQAIGSRSRSVTSIITPGYAPIEQYSSRGDQGPWTDVYALGAVCYHALTGRVPDDASDRVRNDPLTPVAERCVGQASAGFLAAIDWALKVDEGDRPQSVAAWRAALSGKTPDSERKSPVEPEETGNGVEHRQSDRIGDEVCKPAEGEGGGKQREARRKGMHRKIVGIVCLSCLVMAGAYSYYKYIYEPDREREARVFELLSGAGEDLARDRLTSPAGNNAWEKYHAVLALAPGHREASAGLDSVIGRYVTKFAKSLKKKEFDKADEYVYQIRGVWADAPVLSSLLDRLSEARKADKTRLAAEEAERLRKERRRVGRKFRDCAECPEMVVVPSGSFLMGSPDGESGRDDDESPRHRVVFGYRFAVGVNEVTFAEWDACANAGGCAEYRPDDEGWGRGNRPVMHVNWGHVQSYVRWLSQRTGERYRLLSESEWEYVARAGTTTRYNWGNEIGHNRANCDGCGSRWDDEKTAPAGSFSANAWGLYDVYGNVWEWVQDCWNDSYTGAPADGSAWESGNCEMRVFRGGSCHVEPGSLRSAERLRLGSNSRYKDLGFRVARTIEKQ